VLQGAHVRPGIREAGDLGVVEHQAAHVEPDAQGRAHHGEGLVGGARRRAAHAEVQAAHPQRGVDVDGHAERRGARAEGVAQPAHVLDGVDGDGDLGPQPVVGHDLPQGRLVDRRVRHEHVAHAAAHQPRGLRHGVGHHTGEPGAGEHPGEQRAAPHRLGGDPHGQPTGAAHQVVGVGVERVEVDGHERRRQPGRRARPVVRTRHGADPSAMLTR
jgi:hypothetical protein